MLLAVVNALAGAMIGQERTVLPLLPARVFHLHASLRHRPRVVKAATSFATWTCRTAWAASG